MVDTVYYNQSKSELDILYDISFRLSIRLSRDDWKFNMFCNKRQADNYITDTVIDFACVDVNESDSLELAKKIRKLNPSSLIMLVANAELSPMKYLNTSIMPSSLLIRPFSENEAHCVLSEVLGFFAEKQNENNEEVFQFVYQGATKVISYNQIYYFEAREKKVFINVGNVEYCIYDTIDNLEEALPPGFIRIHRSFIVSKSKIDRIFLSKNYVELVNGLEVPLSRSYKPMMKELK